MPTRRAFVQTAGATCGGLLACALRPLTPLSAWGLRQEPLADTSLDAFATATAMLGALRRREVSAVELVDLHRRRIELYNPILQAIVQTSADTARQAAATADLLRTQGVDSPLLGLPVTIKGCIYTQGLPTACGVLERVDLEGTLDARAVRSLRSAGVVILGETNTSPYAMDWQAT